MMKPVKIEFTEKNLTGNAGLVHFGRFIQKLNLKEILMKQISIPRAPNAVFGCNYNTYSWCHRRSQAYEPSGYFENG
ncbi:MAG: hypothetical protein BWK80_41700 [Desulfobacteraceae bacterium IS3]|nr:MAG: hypothetical protein BWK80_41700 [Desulfobacteraceae bacterium IS3]